MKVRGWEWRREKTWNSRLNRSRNSCIKTSEISCCREFFVYFSTLPSRSDQRPIFWSNTYPLMLENATLGEKQPVAAHWPQKKTRGCCHHLSWTRDLPPTSIFHLEQNLSEIYHLCRQICPLTGSPSCPPSMSKKIIIDLRQRPWEMDEDTAIVRGVGERRLQMMKNDCFIT